MKLALLATAALASAAHATVSDLQLVAPKTLAPIPSISRDILLADVDGDADDDLIAVVSEAPTALRVHLSDGAGGYAPGVGYPLANWGEAAAVADIEGDGDLDIVALSHFMTAEVTTLFNDGSGVFTPGPVTALPANSEPRDMDVADLDGDGFHDIVIANWSTYTISVRRGDGSGAFGAPTDYPVLGKAFEIEVADLNGDHAPDVAVANFGGEPTYTIPGEVWVFLNNGNGWLLAPGKHVAGRGVWCVTSGDTDQDGDLDLVSTNRNTFDVSLFANLGNGAFAPQAKTPVGEYPVAACLLDLDGDGALELTVPSDSWSGPIDSLHVLENDGGHFAADSVLSTNLSMWETAAGDADADADEDLFVAAYGELWLFENETPQLDPLLLDVNHMLAGQSAEIALSNGAPLSLAFVAISFAGQAPPLYLPVLDTTFSLQSPQLLATGLVGVSGHKSWSFALPPSAQGIAFWLQAYQFQHASSVIATQIH